ncbi:hypothetical protein KFE98_16345 [bacterium SCSIO 12741]|nr:hypothetical protein KFE98_16345 [bacterium SCSIO 12741]
MKSTCLGILLGWSILLFSGSLAWAQESSELQAAPHRLRHTIAFFQGVTFIPLTRENPLDREQSMSTVNTYGLNYVYTFNHRWALGGMFDFQQAKYYIEDDGEILERYKVAVAVLQAYYEPVRGLNFFAGPGLEFESNENFYVLKVGAEYELYLANNWWIIPEVSYEFKQVYNNYNVGFKIARSFGRSPHH